MFAAFLCVLRGCSPRPSAFKSSFTLRSAPEQTHGVPLKHFQQSAQNHYLTFSCDHRKPNLGTPAPRDLFISALETVRQQYELFVYGFVVMPEHVH